MPYIKNKNKFYKFIQKIPINLTSGELNYLITRILLKNLPIEPKYNDYNSIIGTLECCKLEFYARAVRFYENIKMIQNDDIYADLQIQKNLAWAAGFFDGEGCFYIHKYPKRKDGTRKLKADASCVQKEKELLIRFQNIIGLGKVYLDENKYQKIWCWKTTKIGEAKKVYRLLEPWLSQKRKKKANRVFWSEAHQKLK